MARKAMRMRVAWTPREDEILSELAAKGVTALDIASALRRQSIPRTPDSVSRRAAARGIDLRPRLRTWSEAQTSALIRMYGEGLPLAQIAAAVSLPDQAISKSGVAGKLDRLITEGRLQRRSEAVPAARPAPRSADKALEPTDERAQLTPGPAAVAPTAVQRVQAEPRFPTSGVLFKFSGERQCRWPLNAPSADMMVCGEQTVPGESWCAVHRARAYVPVAARGVARTAEQR